MFPLLLVACSGHAGGGATPDSSRVTLPLGVTFGGWLKVIDVSLPKVLPVHGASEIEVKYQILSPPQSKQSLYRLLIRMAQDKDFVGSPVNIELQFGLGKTIQQGTGPESIGIRFALDPKLAIKGKPIHPLLVLMKDLPDGTSAKDSPSAPEEMKPKLLVAGPWVHVREDANEVPSVAP